MNNQIGRSMATVLARLILVAAVAAGCNVPAISNIGPVVAGQTSSVAGSAFPAGMEPVWIAPTPDGHYVYALNLRDGTISGWAVQATGGLVGLAGSPYQTQLHPVGLSITPN